MALFAIPDISRALIRLQRKQKTIITTSHSPIGLLLSTLPPPPPPPPVPDEMLIHHRDTMSILQGFSRGTVLLIRVHRTGLSAKTTRWCNPGFEPISLFSVY